MKYSSFFHKHFETLDESSDEMIRNSVFEAVVGWSEGVRNLEFGALFSVPEIF